MNLQELKKINDEKRKQMKRSKAKNKLLSRPENVTDEDSKSEDNVTLANLSDKHVAAKASIKES